MTGVHATILPFTLPGGEVLVSVGRALDRLSCGVGRGNWVRIQLSVICSRLELFVNPLTPVSFFHIAHGPWDT